MNCQKGVISSASFFNQNQKDVARKKGTVYSLPVRIGNWNEDLFMKEYKQKLTAYKRDRCQLLAQRIRILHKNLLRGTVLMEEAKFIQYGCNYQLQACDLPTEIRPKPGLVEYGLYLSGALNEIELEKATHFMHGCGLNLSSYKEPCVRNTFVFVGCNGQSEKQLLYYGDDVFIRVCETGMDYPLYVQCENVPACDVGAGLSLRLTQSPDVYCRFKIFHWNPNYRYETVGCGIEPNTRLIIRHVASGHNLAGIYSDWYPTFFGPECAVTCRTYRNSHKMETAENFWKITSQ